MSPYEGKIFKDDSRGVIIEERSDTYLISETSSITVEIQHKFPSFKVVGECDFNHGEKATEPKIAEKDHERSFIRTILKEMNTRSRKLGVALKERFYDKLQGQPEVVDITDQVRRNVSLCYRKDVECLFVPYPVPTYCTSKSPRSLDNDCEVRGSVCCDPSNSGTQCPPSAIEEIVEYNKSATKFGVKLQNQKLCLTVQSAVKKVHRLRRGILEYWSLGGPFTSLYTDKHMNQEMKERYGFDKELLKQVKANTKNEIKLKKSYNQLQDIMENEFCQNWEMLDDKYTQKLAELIYNDLKTAIEIDLITCESGKIPFSIDHENLITLCEKMTNNKVCKHPYDFFACQNKKIELQHGGISHLVVLSLFIPYNELRAYVPLPSPRNQSVLVKFETNSNIYFGQSQKDPKILFKSCDIHRNKNLCMLGKENKYEDVCIRDLLAQTINPHCEIKELAATCSFQKISEAYVLSTSEELKISYKDKMDESVRPINEENSKICQGICILNENRNLSFECASWIFENSFYEEIHVIEVDVVTNLSLSVFKLQPDSVENEMSKNMTKIRPPKYAVITTASFVFLLLIYIGTASIVYRRFRKLERADDELNQVVITKLIQKHVENRSDISSEEGTTNV